MKIAYIISTCDKYIKSRVQYQLQHSLCNVSFDDIYYLSSTPVEKTESCPKIYGWYVNDTPEEIMKKYLTFFNHYANTLNNYDWIFMCDDDTFIYTHRLEEFITSQSLNKNNFIYAGNLLTHLNNEYCTYHSGGAGYLISQSLWKELFKKKRDKYAIWVDDCCIGLWVNEINNVLKMDLNNLFKMENEVSFVGDKLITLHHLKTNIDFEEHGKIVQQETCIITTLCNELYLNKAKKTIIECQTKGCWKGNTVLFYVGTNKVNIELENTFVVQINELDTTILTQYLHEIGGFKNSDGRELYKTIQWSKLQLFSPNIQWNKYCRYPKRIMFIDAGMNILNQIYPLFNIFNIKNKILAFQDTTYDGNSLYFKNQLDNHNECYLENLKLLYDFDENTTDYFINCFWIFDPLIDINYNEMLKLKDDYPLFRTNEMGLMNIYFTFYKKMWMKLNNKYYTYSPLNYPNKNINEFTLIKYL